MTNGALSPEQQRQLRQLPSVNDLLLAPALEQLQQRYGPELVTTAVRSAIDSARATILATTADRLPDSSAEWLPQVEAQLADLIAPTLYPVINATGVIIHTNLGRAPLSQAAQAAIASVAGRYSNLEFDILSGKRGSRTLHAEQRLQQVTGAEAGLVVNNTASAVMMILRVLCAGKEVILSRSQLIEIGGGFRVPDVMAQSGATLVEVGTTNRTHLRDYAAAINENTAAIMVAHHSNFKIIGFTTEPALAELAELAHAHDIPLLFDQGSGALRPTERYGLEAEPLVQDGLAAGCDVVAFSGDKLLGGPQAGIIVGKARYIDQLKKHPLARALRADKLCLAGLGATLEHYLTDRVETEIPVWRMMAATLEELETTAVALATDLRAEGIEAAVIDEFSTVGGGSLPGNRLPSRVVAITHPAVESLAHALRTAPVPVIARIQHNQLLLDPRTLLDGQLDALRQTVLDQCAAL